MVWGGSREEGSGWGTHVYLWRIHFNIWQNQYNIVKSIKKKKKKQKVLDGQLKQGRNYIYFVHFYVPSFCTMPGI